MDDAAARQVLSALRRLYNLERLRSLDAPRPLIENAEKRLDEARQWFGKEIWKQVVEEEYPRYKQSVLRADAAITAWEKKCLSCEHELGNDYVHGDKWCALYTREETMCPAPCPSFKLKVLN